MPFAETKISSHCPLVATPTAQTTAPGEDEFGLINILVSKELAERFRDQIRTEPFVRARGTLEHRAGEQRTLVATHLAALVPSEVFRTPEGKSWG